MLRGSVFQEGIASGIYTDPRSLPITIFHSTEDEGWLVMLDRSPGLSAFGDTPEEALREFCVMLPVALKTELLVTDLSEPISNG